MDLFGHSLFRSNTDQLQTDSPKMVIKKAPRIKKEPAPFVFYPRVKLEAEKLEK